MKLCTQALVFDAYGTLFDVHCVLSAKLRNCKIVFSAGE